jgi:hypothetical protein
MYPLITEIHFVRGINVAAMVRRMVEHLPSSVLEGLKEITLLNTHEKYFGRYIKKEGRIELYVEDIVGWQPWILKKTYFFPYFCIGIELGIGLEQHVYNRSLYYGKEYRPNYPFMYIYPSLGILKIIIKPILYMLKLYYSLKQRLHKKTVVKN